MNHAEAKKLVKPWRSALYDFDGDNAEQCNIRVGRYGGKNVPYGKAAE